MIEMIDCTQQINFEPDIKKQTSSTVFEVLYWVLLGPNGPIFDVIWSPSSVCICISVVSISLLIIFYIFYFYFYYYYFYY